MEKKCIKCGETKSLDSFSKHPKMKDGHIKICKKCNKEKININKPEYTEKQCKQCGITKPLSQFYIDLKLHDGHVNKCNICKQANNKKYRIENPEIMKKCQRKSNQKYKKERNRRSKEKRENDPLESLKLILRGRLHKALDRKRVSKRTTELLGCSFEEVKNHLEKQFKDGMTWENRGVYGWHVDHIIPLSSAKTEEDAIKLCHYTNLQPLWWRENIIKSNKIL